MGEYECVLTDPQAGSRLKISRSLQLVLRFVIRYAYAEDSTMVNVRHYGPAGTTPDEPALALFQKQWQLYRKVVDYNYLFHREAYNLSPPDFGRRGHPAVPVPGCCLWRRERDRRGAPGFGLLLPRALAIAS
jgi:hypothetical protein